MGGSKRSTRATSEKPNSTKGRTNSRATRATASPDPPAASASRATRATSVESNPSHGVRTSARLRGETPEHTSLENVEKKRKRSTASKKTSDTTEQVNTKDQKRTLSTIADEDEEGASPKKKAKISDFETTEPEQDVQLAEQLGQSPDAETEFTETDTPAAQSVQLSPSELEAVENEQTQSHLPSSQPESARNGQSLSPKIPIPHQTEPEDLPQPVTVAEPGNDGLDLLRTSPLSTSHESEPEYIPQPETVAEPGNDGLDLSPTSPLSTSHQSEPENVPQPETVAEPGNDGLDLLPTSPLSISHQSEPEDIPQPETVAEPGNDGLDLLPTSPSSNHQEPERENQLASASETSLRSRKRSASVEVSSPDAKRLRTQSPVSLRSSSAAPPINPPEVLEEQLQYTEEQIRESSTETDGNAVNSASPANPPEVEEDQLHTEQQTRESPAETGDESDASDNNAATPVGAPSADLPDEQSVAAEQTPASPDYPPPRRTRPTSSSAANVQSEPVVGTGLFAPKHVAPKPVVPKPVRARKPQTPSYELEDDVDGDWDNEDRLTKQFLERMGYPWPYKTNDKEIGIDVLRLLKDLGNGKDVDSSKIIAALEPYRKQPASEASVLVSIDANVQQTYQGNPVEGSRSNEGDSNGPDNPVRDLPVPADPPVPVGTPGSFLRNRFGGLFSRMRGSQNAPVPTTDAERLADQYTPAKPNAAANSVRANDSTSRTSTSLANSAAGANVLHAHDSTLRTNGSTPGANTLVSNSTAGVDTSRANGSTARTTTFNSTAGANTHANDTTPRANTFPTNNTARANALRTDTSTPRVNTLGVSRTTGPKTVGANSSTPAVNTTVTNHAVRASTLGANPITYSYASPIGPRTLGPRSANGMTPRTNSLLTRSTSGADTSRANGRTPRTNPLFANSTSGAATPRANGDRRRADAVMTGSIRKPASRQQRRPAMSTTGVAAMVNQSNNSTPHARADVPRPMNKPLQHTPPRTSDNAPSSTTNTGGSAGISRKPYAATVTDVEEEPTSISPGAGHKVRSSTEASSSGTTGSTRKFKEVRKVHTLRRKNTRGPLIFGRFIACADLIDVRKGAMLWMDDYYYVNEEYTDDKELESSRFQDETGDRIGVIRWDPEDECEDDEDEDPDEEEEDNETAVDSSNVPAEVTSAVNTVAASSTSQLTDAEVDGSNVPAEVTPGVNTAAASSTGQLTSAVVDGSNVAAEVTPVVNTAAASSTGQLTSAVVDGSNIPAGVTPTVNTTAASSTSQPNNAIASPIFRNKAPGPLGITDVNKMFNYFDKYQGEDAGISEKVRQEVWAEPEDELDTSEFDAVLNPIVDEEKAKNDNMWKKALQRRASSAPPSN